MELVYLWVEEYKNIKKQGFNFSPRFDCEFEDGKLTVDEKKDYVNIFPENIDVTAIVGENGSGKSSILKLLESKSELKNISSFFVYKKEDQYYCEFKNIKPEIVFDKEVIYIDRDDHFDEDSFYPNIIRIAHDEKIGEDKLSHYYFGKYSGIYGGMNIDRHNYYNMLEARFFVPRYINIATEHIELFNRLNEMYKFDTLRLLLRSNSASHLRQWIDKQIDMSIFSRALGSKKVCIYERTEEVLNYIQKELQCPIEEIEIHLYNKNRETIVSILENIENMHRQQTSTNQIKKLNKFHEFDLAVLIAFIEYYLKNTDSCDPSDLVYETLLELKDEIKNNALTDKNIIRIKQSYILGFFQKLKDKEFKFTKDNLLTIEDIMEAVQYIQKFQVNYFDSDANPYIDIPINTTLKENLHYIRTFQKIFFEYEFDCGEESFLRVFEYDLVNNEIGSSYGSISDGEKHFIRFAIDIIYHLETIKESNITPSKERITLFLADEPDNAMHPIWKKKLINNVIEVLKNYSEIKNIKQHFIFTTHSPFLLSDIPKENVIFLEHYKKKDKEVFEKKQKIGNCKNVSNVTDIKPFGANIHTLLSHGFFMKDGLMGEFAKSKINEVINNLQDKSQSLSQSQMKSIIATIGEPFLQTKLEQMYNEKFGLDDELEELQIQQDKINLKIEQLKKQKSENVES